MFRTTKCSLLRTAKQWPFLQSKSIRVALRRSGLISSRDIAALSEGVQDIVAERKSRFKRFFSAKRHRNELQDVMNQLDMARTNYTVSRVNT